MYLLPNKCDLLLLGLPLLLLLRLDYQLDHHHLKWDTEDPRPLYLLGITVHPNHHPDLRRRPGLVLREVQEVHLRRCLLVSSSRAMAMVDELRDNCQLFLSTLKLL